MHDLSSFLCFNYNMRQMDIGALMRENRTLSNKEKFKIVAQLSIPAILANISEIVMQYIDASMVGSLGEAASASIGLVTSSTWLILGLMIACAYGFSVQVAQATGANNLERTHSIFKQSLIIGTLFALLISYIGVHISPLLPIWLNGANDIIGMSSDYFRIYCLFIPIRQLFLLTHSMLQCVGNMKVPSLLDGLACLLDIVFNFFLIFPSRTIMVFGNPMHVFGFGLGVKGAAIGTGLAYTTSFIFMLHFACFKTPQLNIDDGGDWSLHKDTFIESLHIGIPMALEQSALALAQIVAVRIVAPLGTIAIAAHSFADTAEALCYMPGYGIGAAATTLVGQAVGAKRKDIAKSMAWLTTFIGMAIMGTSALCMYFLSPYVMAFLTPVVEVSSLAVSVLRIELIAEPLFAASIIACGALRGAGDTMVPALLNLASIWAIRIPLGAYLVRMVGLKGMWIAMCFELNVRGMIFILRLKRGKWLDAIPDNESMITN